MASRSKFVLYLIVTFYVTLSSVTECYDIKTHKLLFVFGDSLFDTGNNPHLPANEGRFPTGTLWPYGITFFHKPTGRISDGRLLPDFIATNAKLRLPVPYLEERGVFIDGINFASAGSGVLGESETAAICPSSSSINLGVQLQYFKTVVKQLEQLLGHEEAQSLLHRSVFLFSIGGNDYMRFNMNSDPTLSEQVELVGQVMGNYTAALEEFYALGVKKIGFQNVGPLSCMPNVRQKTNNVEVDCVDRFMSQATLYNSFLATVLEQYELKHPGFKYALFDYYNALRDRILHPTEHGFKVGNVGCRGSGVLNGENCSTQEPFNLCEDVNVCVFFDGGHHTDRANFQLAQLMWTGPKHVTGLITMSRCCLISKYM
ncbi:GDSL esterase/lipase 4-like [Pistacia vera]|uniref:GDSL esterase/lipase 4-like n=1 Tax=Pistacia vera TaxID=55513 RepID=UPI001263CB4D|nr:GDSL esterase/lipase 4-like [Pistacia vera]